jgi:hypothetical protein
MSVGPLPVLSGRVIATMTLSINRKDRVLAPSELPVGRPITETLMTAPMSISRHTSSVTSGSSFLEAPGVAGHRMPGTVRPRRFPAGAAERSVGRGTTIESADPWLILRERFPVSRQPRVGRVISMASIRLNRTSVGLEGSKRDLRHYPGRYSPAHTLADGLVHPRRRAGEAQLVRRHGRRVLDVYPRWPVGSTTSPNWLAVHTSRPRCLSTDRTAVSKALTAWDEEGIEDGRRSARHGPVPPERRRWWSGAAIAACPHPGRRPGR